MILSLSTHYIHNNGITMVSERELVTYPYQIWLEAIISLLAHTHTRGRDWRVSSNSAKVFSGAARDTSQ